MDAIVRLEHELLAVETEHSVHAMLELVAPAAPTGDARVPLRLALVIDRSGSMGGEKIETTKECARFLARRLEPTDELAIITYDDDVELRAPLVPVDADALIDLIGAIHPGGMTNLSGGWLKGTEVLGQEGVQDPADAAVPRTVLLLTDGLANVGITDPATLIGMATNARGRGIGTSTIGFGDGFAEDLLTALADAGGGNAYHAATAEDAPGIFAQECEGLLALVAQNLSVEIRPVGEVEMLGVLHAFPTVAVPGGVQVQLGDVYGGDRRSVMFELHVPSLASLGPAKVADVVLRYVTVGEQVAAHETTIPIVVNLVSADEAAAAVPDAQVVEEVVVLSAAKAQEAARDLADQGEFDQARKVLREAAEGLRSRASGSSKAAELLDQAEQMEMRSESMSEPLYDSLSRKSMHYDSHRRLRGRKPPASS